MIPASVKIGPQIIAIRISELLPQDGDCGSFYSEIGEIHISNTLSPGQQEVTLVHEILHACCNFAGIDDEKLTEEQFCTRLENTMHMVLKDNPNLFTAPG